MEYKYLFVYFIGYLEIKKAEVILLLSPSCGGLTIQPYLSFLSFIVHQDINLQIIVFSDDICL